MTRDDQDPGLTLASRLRARLMHPRATYAARVAHSAFHFYGERHTYDVGAIASSRPSTLTTERARDSTLEVLPCAHSAAMPPAVGRQ
jgi:hypothetical protein